MLHAYLNYPNARVSLHGRACGHIQQSGKQQQRHVLLNHQSIGIELKRFVDDEHDFAAQAAKNDMWLEVSLSGQEREIATVEYIQRLLGARYKRFRDCTIEWHCR